MNTLSNGTINSDTLEALAIPLEVDAALYVKQLDIELYIHDKAVQAFNESLDKSITSGAGDETATGMSIMSKAIPLVADGINEWLDANKAKGAGRKHLAIKPLTDVADTRIIAALALSTMLSHVMKEDSYLTGVAFQIAMKLEEDSITEDKLSLQRKLIESIETGTGTLGHRVQQLIMLDAMTQAGNILIEFGLD